MIQDHSFKHQLIRDILTAMTTIVIFVWIIFSYKLYKQIFLINILGVAFTSCTKTHSGAKIQNGYKILSVDTYYKGKLAYPHFRNAHCNLTRKFTFRLKFLDFFKNSVSMIPKNWWWSLNDRVRYLPHIVIWRENSRSDRYVNN